MSQVHPKLFVVMGVSGSGKSTVGEALAEAVNGRFFDADDFHPAENVAKMSSGVPLTDEDRWPWLARLTDLLTEMDGKGETAVLACSALKKSYRDKLRVNTAVTFIYLDGSFELIWERMQTRANHYMKASMLQSQFDALERPTGSDVLTISIDQPIDQIVPQILQNLLEK